jgi:hypothetical protein
MDHINELTSILQVFFLWNKSRCHCLAQVMIALFTTRTVNMSILSESFVGRAKSDSYYKRIVRFFSWLSPTACLKMKLGKAVLAILGIKENISLSIDRTDWALGSSKRNFLIVGVCYRKVCVPIYWNLLPKKNKNGACSNRQMISILKKIVSMIGIENIQSIAADREFVGTKWFHFLVDEGIPFVIRIKENTLIKRPGTDRPTSAKELCKRIKNGRYSYYQ